MSVLAGHFYGKGGEGDLLPCCIVAVGTWDGEGDDAKLVDWCAYIGGYADGLSRQDGAEAVARNGDKLSLRTAVSMFPALPAALYRE